jgi:hypothetical protein
MMNEQSQPNPRATEPAQPVNQPQPRRTQTPTTGTTLDLFEPGIVETSEALDLLDADLGNDPGSVDTMG